MKINVTKEHIKNGRRCASHGCPIALAVLDAIPLSFIAVGNFSISYRIESDNELGNVALPPQSHSASSWSCPVTEVWSELAPARPGYTGHSRLHSLRPLRAMGHCSLLPLNSSPGKAT